MTHIAIQEELDGNAVEWLEHVTDEQYQRGNAFSVALQAAHDDSRRGERRWKARAHCGIGA